MKKAARSTATTPTAATLATPTTGKASLTIDEWCDLHSFCRQTFYNFADAGIGPRTFKVGKCVRISAESNATWILEREAASAAASGKAGKPTTAPATARG